MQIKETSTWTTSDAIKFLKESHIFWMKRPKNFISLVDHSQQKVKCSKVKLQMTPPTLMKTHKEDFKRCLFLLRKEEGKKLLLQGLFKSGTKFIELKILPNSKMIKVKTLKAFININKQILWEFLKIMKISSSSDLKLYKDTKIQTKVNIRMNWKL